MDAAKKIDENITHIIHQLETNLAGVRKNLKLPETPSASDLEEEDENMDDEKEELNEEEGKKEVLNEEKGKKEKPNEEDFKSIIDFLDDAESEQKLKEEKAGQLETETRSPINKDCILVLNKVFLIA